MRMTIWQVLSAFRALTKERPMYIYHQKLTNFGPSLLSSPCSRRAWRRKERVEMVFSCVGGVRNINAFKRRCNTLSASL